MSKQIPNLRYKAVRVTTYFGSYGIAVVWVRDDMLGRPYIDNVDYRYGHDGRIVRRNALQEAREKMTYKRSRGLRSMYVTADSEHAIRRALPECVRNNKLITEKEIEL